MIRVINEQSPDRNSLSFKTGDIINHKTYGYRGVIVHQHSTFKGEDEWYLSNQSQPSKHQPWYFVLVNEIQQVTYVAESNLTLDRLGKKVDHAMINLFFSEYDNELKKYYFVNGCNVIDVITVLKPCSQISTNKSTNKYK